MTGYYEARLHEAYNKILIHWGEKLKTIELNFKNNRVPLNSPNRTVLISKYENLKSHFYSLKYFSSFDMEDFKVEVKTLLNEMKELETDINSLMKTNFTLKELKLI